MKGWVLGVSRYALACNISQAYLCAATEQKKHEAIEACQKLIQKGASTTDVNRDGFNFIGAIVANKLDHFLQTFGGLSRNEAKIPASSSGSCFSSSPVAAQAVAKPVAKPTAKKKKKFAAKIFSKFQKKH